MSSYKLTFEHTSASGETRLITFGETWKNEEGTITELECIAQLFARVLCAFEKANCTVPPRDYDDVRKAFDHEYASN